MCHEWEFHLRYVTEFRVTSQNLLSSRYIMCTTDPCSIVKEESQKVLGYHQNNPSKIANYCARTRLYAAKCYSEECTSVLRTRYRALSLAPVKSVSFQVRFLSGLFLRVAICAIVSTSRFLALRQDGYYLHQVGHDEPSHALVSSIRKLVRTLISQDN